MSQFTVPSMALKVVDRAMQVYGAEGICQDTPLAAIYAGLRTLRYADVSVSLDIFLIDMLMKWRLQGPDEVHIQQIGKAELKRVPMLVERTQGIKKRSEKLMRESGITKAKL